MSYPKAFSAVVREFGELVEIRRDGELLGSGLAILQPRHRGEEGFLPTDLGTVRRDPVLCFAQADLPLDPWPGETEIRRGDDRWRVVNVRSIEVKGVRLFWRAVLEWREEDEA